MRRRGVWLRPIAISCVLGIIGLSPAFARGGGAAGGFSGHASRAAFAHAPRWTFRGYGAASFNRSIAAQGRQGSAQAARQQTVQSAAIGPYSWFIGGAPDEIYPVDNTRPDPYVIVISQVSPVPVSPKPNPAPEISIAGCHPIPNGYHCDTPTADRHPDAATGGAPRNAP